MSTYLDHGGAEREHALAQLWDDLETRVARDEEVRVEHLHACCPSLACGWHDDESALVVAFSGHAYRRVMDAVEQLVAQPHAPLEDLERLRLAHTLLLVSRELATQVRPRQRPAL